MSLSDVIKSLATREHSKAVVDFDNELVKARDKLNGQVDRLVNLVRSSIVLGENQNEKRDFKQNR